MIRDLIKNADGTFSLSEGRIMSNNPALTLLDALLNLPAAAFVNPMIPSTAANAAALGTPPRSLDDFDAAALEQIYDWKVRMDAVSHGED